MSDDHPADAVFALLSDETRVDVLRAVATAQHERGGASAGPVELSFTELYDLVDVDNTSKLSYHLGELAGTFLRKSDDGYSFTYAGERVARFVLSGNYDQPPEFGPKPVAGTCVFCGAERLAARLHHRFFRIDCQSCDQQVVGQPVTPAQAQTFGGDEFVRSVRATSSLIARRIRSGVCPQCNGRLSTEVRDMRDGPLPDADPFLATSECGACLARYNHPLTYTLAYHPASVAFHWERGIDVTVRGIWEFHEPVFEGRWTSERVASDPAEYEVVLRRGSDALRARVDDSARVAYTERVRRAGADDADS